MRLHPAHGADELIAPSRGMLVSLYRSAAARMTPVHLRMSWAMLWSKHVHIVAVRSLHRISTISRRATLEGCALDIPLGSWDILRVDRVAFMYVPLRIARYVQF